MEKKFMLEGVYDPAILKAAFTAGGPGSGKSTLIGQIFGIIMNNGQPVTKSLTATGFKILNSDNVFEHYLKKYNINPADLHKLTDQEFAKLTVSDSSARAKAQKMIVTLSNVYMNGRLGLIIDSTSSNRPKIESLNKKLQSFGYDTYMIFVNTDLEIAKQRNLTRDRILPEKVLVNSWYEAEANKNYYKEVFGRKFIEIDNNVYGNVDKKMEKYCMKIATLPVENSIGKQWITDELRIKNKLKK